MASVKLLNKILISLLLKHNSHPFTSLLVLSWWIRSKLFSKQRFSGSLLTQMENLQYWSFFAVIHEMNTSRNLVFNTNCAVLFAISSEFLCNHKLFAPMQSITWSWSILDVGLVWFSIHLIFDLDCEDLTFTFPCPT